MKKAIAYYRVSTQRQGRSGLGLDAQRAIVQQFCSSNGLDLVMDFKDIESGKHSNRPGLLQALDFAKKENAKLVIAKLDRLSRDVEFIMHLRNSNVDFVACDLPECNTLTLTVMAALAQMERELISNRTKAALAEVKKRGQKLGTNNLSPEARQKAAIMSREKALQHYNGALVHAIEISFDSIVVSSAIPLPVFRCLSTGTNLYP